MKKLKQTSVDEVEAPLLEEDELVHLHVQREGGSSRRGRWSGDGEVDAVGVVGAQRLHERAQVRRAQALTWMNPSVSKSLC